MVKFSFFMLVAVTTLAFTCSSTSPVHTAMNQTKNPYYSKTDTTKLILPDSVWQQVLEPDVFEVARHAATERPFTVE